MSAQRYMAAEYEERENWVSECECVAIFFEMNWSEPW